MSRILVIGGAGYIGSHVSKLLAQKSRNKILTFDNLSTGFRELVRYGVFKKAHLHSQKQIEQVLLQFKPTAVMHFANFALVAESVADPEKYYRNNVTGTQNLLMALSKQRKKVPLIFSSSCAVYGTPQGPLVESHPMLPVNPYGTCKMIVERMLADYSAAYGFPYVSLRYFNAAGADPDGELGELHSPETHLIPRVIHKFQGREEKRDPVIICGTDYDTPDGTCVRDYIHVMDLADAHVKAVEYLQDGGKSVPLNLGLGHGYSVREVIASIQKISGKTIRIPEGPRRPGDPAKLVAVNAKAKSVLGWKPKYNLEEIIASAWKWAASR